VDNYKHWRFSNVLSTNSNCFKITIAPPLSCRLIISSYPHVYVSKPNKYFRDFPLRFRNKPLKLSPILVVSSFISNLLSSSQRRGAWSAGTNLQSIHNCTVQSASWDTKCRSDSQETIHFVWNPKFHYIRKGSPLVPLQRQMNPVRTAHSFSFRSISVLPFYLCQGLTSSLFSTGFPANVLYAFPIFHFVSNASPVPALIIFCKEYELWSQAYLVGNTFHPRVTSSLSISIIDGLILIMTTTECLCNVEECCKRRRFNVSALKWEMHGQNSRPRTEQVSF
jgi:hypothetical protein